MWLGEHAAGSEALFRGLPARPIFELSWRESWLAERDAKPRQEKEPVSAEEAEYLSPVWTAFLSRPYWTRTWIIQEIVLAKDLLCHCGPDVGWWDDLFGETLDPRTTEPFEATAALTGGRSKAPSVLARVLRTSNAFQTDFELA